MFTLKKSWEVPGWFGGTQKAEAEAGGLPRVCGHLGYMQFQVTLGYRVRLCLQCRSKYGIAELPQFLHDGPVSPGSKTGLNLADGREHQSHWCLFQQDQPL